MFRNYKSKKYNKNTAIFIYFAIVLISLVSVIILPSPYGSRTEEDISVQIREIAETLSESSSKISMVQKELETRIKYVEELKVEAQTAEDMISLSEEQVNAIQAKLNEELTANDTRGLYQEILLSTFFLLLGFAPSAFHYIKRKQGKKEVVSTEKYLNNKYSAEQIEQAIKLLDIIDSEEKKK